MKSSCVTWHCSGKGLALTPVQLPSMCGTTDRLSAGHPVFIESVTALGFKDRSSICFDDNEVYGILYNPGDGRWLGLDHFAFPNSWQILRTCTICTLSLPQLVNHGETSVLECFL